ncbi:MAG: hypothetical protein Q4G68_08675 [Planctomycetia bacterium]|nr:hypothetical protein [Planctomycetia bacterium]
MNIWNKVLLVLITLTGIGFMILASNRYVLQKDWATKIQNLEKKLAQAESEVQTLEQEIYGDPLKKERDWDNLPLLAQKERIRSLISGAIWVGCESQTISSQNNRVTTSFILPTQYNYAGVRPSSLVYLFDSGAPFVAVASSAGAEAPAEAGTESEATEEASETPAEPAPAPEVAAEVDSSDAAAAEPAIATAPARFLGIFKIEAVNRSEINLSSVNNMTQDEIDLLDQSIKGKNSWIVCPDRPPVDSPADLKAWCGSNSEFLTMLSAEEQDFLLKDEFTPGEALVIGRGDMDSDHVEKRLPLDFNYLLEQGYTKRDTLTATIARKEMSLADVNLVLVEQLLTMGMDIPEVAQAVVDRAVYDAAKAEYKHVSMTDKKTQLTAALASMKKQCEIVHDKLELVETTLAEMRAEIESLLAKNRDLAIGIAQSQFQAVNKILGLSAQTEPTSDTGVANSRDLVQGI